ncbi:MAG: helix-turn-helix transcriptional regulator [Campylobacterales bacterium]|nr:helix-turn-helix transcriptional regulator [Campylobacterales bacterium]
MHSYEEPVYMISVVAQLLEIHPQTLRQYEREGLVTPSRSDGKIRLYSQKNIDEIKMILRLTRELGVNLAGVDVILQMKTQIGELEKEVEDLRGRLSSINEHSVVPDNKAVVCTTSRKVVIIEEK